MPYYRSAYDIDMRRVIDIYVAAQKHIDQGMSLTLFMRSELPEGMYEWKAGRTNKMTTRDLNILRNYACEKRRKINLLCAHLYGKQRRNRSERLRIMHDLMLQRDAFDLPSCNNRKA